jgi:hypothetical protein
MKAAFTFAVLALIVLWMAYCKPAARTQSGSGANATAAAATDKHAAERARELAIARQMIRGREKMRADSVYAHLETFKTIPAENLLNIMDRWGQALGVSCEHCHVENDWSAENKPEKRVARQMVTLVEHTNADLGKITGIKSEKPRVGCNTCHRGEARPGVRK